MGKKVEHQTEPAKNTTAHIAIKRSDFQKVLTLLKASRNVISEERQSLSELIREAVDHKHLHKGAMAMAVQLDKMDPLARAEKLWNFDLYRQWLGWDRETSDLLPDRSQPQINNTHADFPENAGFPDDDQAAPADDDADLRPRHLPNPH